MNTKISQTEHIYALSLWQPWASLLVLGEKQYETRHWSIPARHLPRTTAIHAAERWSSAQRELCEQDPHIRASLIKHAKTLAEHVHVSAGYLKHIRFMLGEIPIHMPIGYLIGIGDFTSCWETEVLTGLDQLTPREKAMGNYEPQRFAFGFSHPRLITPMQHRGRQRWWRVPKPWNLTEQQ